METIQWNEETLNKMLTTPSQGLIEDVAKMEGDIMILGAGGKMGPDMCILAARAVKAAGVKKAVYAVSRFSDKAARERLEAEGVTVISADLMADGVLENLPECKNIVFMAGRKFGTNGSEYLTWGMNSWLPCMVANRFRKSNIVAFSSGNLYPKDLDSALLQQEVIRDETGVRLGELTIVPVSVSSIEKRNNFQPTPYESGTEGYDRVLSKLDGGFSGPNLTIG